MGSGGAPKDNSAEVARIEAEEARRAREAEETRRREERERFDTNVSSAFDNALLAANDFFTTQGLDPNEFSSAITTRANAIRGGIPDLDASPGSYFEGLGQSVYDAEEAALRNRLGRTIDEIAPYGFAANRITDTADDATLAAILAEQQADAEQYARNLLERGVITQTGFDAALEDVAGQRAGAQLRLDELGAGELERGRASLRDIANTGRSTVDNLRLGSTFDPYQVGTNIDTEAINFFDNLGQTLRGLAPTDLFSTSGLANVAGSAQGAQNLPFDPNALAGLAPDTEEDDDEAVGDSISF